MFIYCCDCKSKVKARLKSGEEIYPHRTDLSSLPFWKCDTCKNHVGCHHKTKNRTRPLGNIPNKEMRNARQHLHKIIDPLWMGKRKSRDKRSRIYQHLSEFIGREYHTAEIKKIETARKIYKEVKRKYYTNP